MEILSGSVFVPLIYYESVKDSDSDCEELEAGIMQLRLSVQHNRHGILLCPLDASYRTRNIVVHLLHGYLCLENKDMRGDEENFFKYSPRKHT